MSPSSFDSLYNYISRNQDESTDGEKPFSLFARGRKKQIRIKNYVGVIETSEGLHLEILPKIHLTQPTRSEELILTKNIFLKMLRHLKDSPFANINYAHLQSKKNFPILEVFIRSYINEAERVFKAGVNADYLSKKENVKYLRGKLLVIPNIKSNHSNRARFFCEFSEFSQNVAANRLVKTTLLRLMRVTTSYSNYSALNRILGQLEEVEPSQNISYDITVVRSAGRLWSRYSTLLNWSEIFLLNKSFTNFRGDSENLAVLFPMERVFEDYIAYLILKYADGRRIRLQDKSYFLVERHKGEGRFALRPDVVIQNENSNSTIIDTKWKIIDQSLNNKNYNISQSDMYQLYAYGKKYTRNKVPHLVLLYPSNPKFTSKLQNFVYEGDLKLEVVPFDFNAPEVDQIRSLLDGSINTVIVP